MARRSVRVTFSKQDIAEAHLYVEAERKQAKFRSDLRRQLGEAQRHFIELRHRVAELERLVPVPLFLDRVAEALGLSSDGEWKEMRKELRATATAVRKYEEAQAAALRGGEGE